MKLTWIECDLSEAAIGASLCAHETELHEQTIVRIYSEECLSAPRCERCQDETDHMLRLSAGEALCHGCIEVEFCLPDLILERARRLL